MAPRRHPGNIGAPPARRNYKVHAPRSRRPLIGTPRPGADRNPVSLWFVLGCATLLRLLNAGAAPTNDEAISALAARGVADTGVPVLPSGAVYVRDPLFHYALGAAFALPGPDELAGRLLGVAFSLAAVLGAHRLALGLFGSPAAATGAAVLAAIDPFSASYAARLRMYSALQAAVVWALVFFERAFVPGRPRVESSLAPADENPAPMRALRRTLPALVLFAAAFLTQRLAVLLIPALGLVWLAERGWRRSGVIWIVPAALLAAGALAGPRLLPHLREPAALQAVQGAYLSAPDLEEARRSTYLDTLRAKLPARPAAIGRAALLAAALGLAAAGIVLRARWRRPGLRLLAYAVLPAALTWFWPTSVFFDARYFLHLLPIAAVLLAAGVVAWLPDVRGPSRAVVVAATAASACFLLWGTPVWDLRYAAFLLPFLAGAPARPGGSAALEAHGPTDGRRSPLRSLGGRARRLLRPLAWPSACVAFALPLTGAALWWVAVLPFEPALRHAALRHRPADTVLADGHVPLVAWRLGDVDGAVPNYSLNVFRSDDRVLGDLYAGAPPVETPAALAELARVARVWWFDHAPAGLDPAHAAFVRTHLAPLRRLAGERFHAAVRCGEVTLWDSRPHDPGAPTLGCDLRPLSSAPEAP